MRFQIEAETTGGLRVIGDIPDFPIGRLEGLNGVGKTVAIHLLELATGAQPYAHQPSAWRSLRENLKAGAIAVSALKRGGHELRIQLTPDLWPPEPTIPGPWFGVAKLDGQPLPLADLPSLLKVRRVGGDETLLVQIRRRIRADSDSFSRADEWMQSNLAGIEVLADELHELGQGLSESAREDVDARVDALAEQRRDAEKTLSALAGRQRLVDRLVAREVALSQIDRRGPELDAQIRSLDAEIRRQERERDALQRRRDELQPTADRAKALSKQIKSLERRRAIQRGQLESERSRFNELVDAAGSNPAHLAEDLASAQNEKQTLIRERRGVGLLPETMQTIGDLQVPLATAVDSGLADEVVAVVRAERITAGDLRDGVVVRLGELEEVDDYRVVEEMDVRLALLNDRIALLDAASTLVPSLERRTKSLAETDLALAAAYEKARSTSGDAYAAVIGDMQSLDEVLARNIATRAELRQARAMLHRHGDAPTLRGEIAELRKDLDDERSAVELRNSVQEEAVKLRIDLAEVESLSEATVQERRELELRLEGAYRAIAEGAYRWLLPDNAADIGDSPSDPRFSEALEKIVDGVERLRRAANALPLRTGRMRAVYTGLADHVGQASLPQQGDEATLLEFYERELGALLSTEQISTTVLEGGAFRELDLASGDLAWDDVDGTPVRRPLEAFSSGQAAFTYILASILQRSEDLAENRVLVLDEFGAFIQGDRIRILLDFLEREVLGQGRADQVLVVLPLRQLDGDQAQTELAGLREQVIERGYGVMEIG